MAFLFFPVVAPMAWIFPDRSRRERVPCIYVISFQLWWFSKAFCGGFSLSLLCCLWGPFSEVFISVLDMDVSVLGLWATFSPCLAIVVGWCSGERWWISGGFMVRLLQW